MAIIGDSCLIAIVFDDYVYSSNINVNDKVVNHQTATEDQRTNACSND